MKDFTKKGTKLPVIPVGTEYRTEYGGIEKFKTSKSNKGVDKLISFGLKGKYILADYCNSSNKYLFKLSTIERLAKEQGMYNTNNEIEMKTEFKIGDYVKVIRDGANASDFTLKIPSCKINGVYSKNNWENIKFQILGNYEPITFEHNPKIYGAYPLGIDGKIIGYVYNDAIQHYSDMNPTIKLQENGTVTVTDTETTTTLSKVTVDEICRLVKEQPKLRKINVWYGSKEYPKLCWRSDESNCYGLNWKGNWEFKSRNSKELSTLTDDDYELSPETVEQYLREEAVKRGFVKGTKYKHIKFDTVEVLKKPENLKLILHNDCNNLTDGCGGSIFEKGVWATIIHPKTITRAEAEKRYDVKITD